MNDFAYLPKEITILVVSDVDWRSVTSLSEIIIRKSPEYDLIVVCGPFIHKESESKEEASVQKSEMAAIIAQLENIVCRVVYLPSESDPVDTLTEQSYLTPNSVNIHGRKMTLLNNVYIAGYTEKSDNLRKSKLPEDFDRTQESDDELEGVEVHSQTTSELIEDLLFSELNPQLNFEQSTCDLHLLSKVSQSEDLSIQSDQENSISINKFGIFLFNYKYAHSLSYFLFHMTDKIETSGVKLCIIPATSADSSRLPEIFGSLHIVTPKSLRNTGYYNKIVLTIDNNENWKVEKVTEESIQI